MVLMNCHGPILNQKKNPLFLCYSQISDVLLLRALSSYSASSVIELSPRNYMTIYKLRKAYRAGLVEFFPTPSRAALNSCICIYWEARDRLHMILL